MQEVVDTFFKFINETVVLIPELLLFDKVLSAIHERLIQLDGIGIQENENGNELTLCDFEVTSETKIISMFFLINSAPLYKSPVIKNRIIDDMN